MKLHEFLLWTALCLLTATFLAFDTTSARAGRVLNDALATKPFSHHIWQEMINQSVNSAGEVDLAKLRARPERLNQYLDQLAAVSPDSHPDYFPTPDDTLAYWLNAHNAVALRLILNRYPADTLADRETFENETLYSLGKQPYSLARIKRKVAAGYSRHPAALLALSDYTFTAPPLYRQVYQGAGLRRQLTAAAHVALQEGRLIQTRRQGDCLGIRLSPFFQAYESALLRPAPGISEDRDLYPAVEETDDPARLRSWSEVIRPLSPPDLAAELARACQHPVEFLPPDPAIRQLGPL